MREQRVPLIVNRRSSFFELILRWPSHPDEHLSQAQLIGRWVAMILGVALFIVVVAYTM